MLVAIKKYKHDIPYMIYYTYTICQCTIISLFVTTTHLLAFNICDSAMVTLLKPHIIIMCKVNKHSKPFIDHEEMKII